MKSHDGFIQGYNAQAAVDADSQVIVARTLTNNASDQQQLAPIVAQIKQNTKRQAQELSADAGYCSEDNLKITYSAPHQRIHRHGPSETWGDHSL